MPRKNKIIIRTGTGAPVATDFVTSEPAWDSTNGKLYIKNAAGTMVDVTGSGGGGGDIDGGTYPLITISSQPASTTIAANNSGSMSVTAAATSPTATISYQWQVSTNSGSTWSNVSGATSSTLTLSNAQSSQNNYQYRCYLTANLSAVYSSAATLTVTSGFTATAVLLTSGTSYTVPAGATSMKAWAVGAGGTGYYAGGGGGCAYKTYTVTGGSTVTYACGARGATSQNNGGNTTVTYGGVTITGGGGSGTIYGTPPGGTFSGGDGGANGGNGDWKFGGYNGSVSCGGAVGGNAAALAACDRRPMTDVSGLKAALTLAGVSTTESCAATAAFGSGAVWSKYSTSYAAGYGGGSGSYGNWGSSAGAGAVILYFT